MAIDWCVCASVQYHDHASEVVQLHRGIKSGIRSRHHLLTAEASKGNHAISAMTAYYCEGKIHGDTWVVECSPACNSCTHTLAGEKHYSLLDSITLAPTNLAPLELKIFLVD